VVACLGTLILGGTAFAQEPPPVEEPPIVTTPAPNPAPIPTPTPDPAPESRPPPAPASSPAPPSSAPRSTAAPPRAVRTVTESVRSASTPAPTRSSRPRQVSPIDRLKPAPTRKSARRRVGSPDRKVRAKSAGQTETARPGPKTARPEISSGVRDDDSDGLSALGPVLILTFGVSTLLLGLAAVPLAWSRRLGLSVHLANIRGALAVIGLFILLDTAVLALLFTI
jgi:hypothetical protein